MNDLLGHVDAVLQKVRAGRGRKLKMRHELLAHLSDIYEEELARLGDETAALGETIRRFGGAGEVGRQLQRTVPLMERALHSPLPGSTLWDRSLAWVAEPLLNGRARGIVVLALATLLAMLPLLLVRTTGAGESLGVLAVAAAVVGLAVVFAVLCAGVARDIARVRGPRPLARTAGRGIAAVAVAGLSTIPGGMLLGGDPVPAARALTLGLVVTAVALCSLCGLARAAGVAKACQDEWEDLGGKAHALRRSTPVCGWWAVYHDTAGRNATRVPHVPRPRSRSRPNAPDDNRE